MNAALELRVRVFCDEQGVSREAELDGRDDRAAHVVAIDEDGDVIATCRLFIFDDGECRLGRMAVAAERRGGGVGRALLDVAEAEAVRLGAREVVLHAQTRAEPFYASCGYVPEGERFMQEGIEHIQMHKAVAGR
ncbi:MAG TPA: GNAT family N-acetyltransferase [Solirubrobacterales bacterium]|nr:GNAT family N-acetyltransferase [Solirubrobacterales bacterium]